MLHKHHESARGEHRTSENIALPLIEGWQEEAAGRVPWRQQSVLMSERKSLLHVSVVSSVYIWQNVPQSTPKRRD